MSRKNIAMMIFMLVATLLLTGCWDVTEPLDECIMYEVLALITRIMNI